MNGDVTMDPARDTANALVRLRLDAELHAVRTVRPRGEDAGLAA